MCGPVGGILQAGIGAMGAIASYNASVEDFNAKEAMWKQNYVNSLASAREEHAQLTIRAQQEQVATGQRIEEFGTEGAIKAAQAEAAAAGAGVTGNSVDEIVGNIIGSAGRNRAAAQVNADYTAQQIAMEQRGVVSTMQNRINSVQRPRAPDPAAAFLNVAGAIVGGIGGMM